MNEETISASLEEIKQGIDRLVYIELLADRKTEATRLKRLCNSLAIDVGLLSAELKQRYIDTKGELDRAEDEIDSDLFLKRKGDEPEE